MAVFQLKILGFFLCFVAVGVVSAPHRGLATNEGRSITVVDATAIDIELLKRYASEVAGVDTPAYPDSGVVLKWVSPTGIFLTGRADRQQVEVVREAVTYFDSIIPHSIYISKFSRDSNFLIVFTNSISDSMTGQHREFIEKFHEDVDELSSTIYKNNINCDFRYRIEGAAITQALGFIDVRQDVMSLQVCISSMLSRSLGLLRPPKTVPSLYALPTSQIIPNLYEFSVLKYIYSEKVMPGIPVSDFVSMLDELAR